MVESDQYMPGYLRKCASVLHERTHLLQEQAVSDKDNRHHTRVYDGETQLSESVSDWGPQVYMA